MKKLLEYILEGIIGKNSFAIEEKIDEDTYTYDLKVDPESIGLIIGKGGKTINAIQAILRVKGKLENKKVFVNVAEEQ